jgi:phosphoglycerate dehydrogenase-like enzyme
MQKPLVVKAGLALVFTLGMFWPAANAYGTGVKIVFNGVSHHNDRAYTDAAVASYRAAADGGSTFIARTAADLEREAADADAVIGGFTKDVFARAKKLRWVQIYSTGVEMYRWEEFLKSPVVLTNCKIAQGPNIADHAMALLLSLTRGLNTFYGAKGKEEWQTEGQKLYELQDMTAVITGVGGIDSQIAQRAHAFGMKVIGVYPKDLPPSVAVTKIVYPSALDTVLPQADVVFVSAPLTPESRGMVGPQQFDLMKTGSFFVCVSLGGLYDTPSLAKALDSGKIAGAGLDVTNPEPLPKNHPLWKFPNVTITPHVAGNSPGSYARRDAIFEENINRFVHGQPLKNVVDKQKGY